MLPSEYMTVIVLPTVDEYLTAMGDLRRAILACQVTHHVRDYVARAGGGSMADVDRKMRSLCKFSYDVLEGVANGSKHCGRDRGDFRFVPGDAKPVLPFAFDVAGAGWDEGRFDGPGLEVEHEGHRVFIDFCVCAVLGSFGRAFPAEFSSVDLERYGQRVPGWTSPPPLTVRGLGAVVADKGLGVSLGQAGEHPGGVGANAALLSGGPL
jgi:hypothetical protein